MIKFLPYLFPFLADMMLGSVFFVCTVRLSQSGASTFAVSSVVTVWALSYMVVSKLTGFFVKNSNAVPTILIASGLISITSLLFIFIPGIYMQLGLMVLVAISVGLFFVPFQVFMKEYESANPRGVTNSAGLYTFSWSLGIATGPFVSGCLWNFGWQLTHWINFVIGILIFIGFLYLKNAKKPVPVPEKIKKNKSLPAVDYSTAPDLAWLGWMGTGVCTLVLAIMKGIFPATAKNLNVSELDQGIVLAIISYVQGFVAIMLCGSRVWMYKALPVLGFTLLSIIGLLFFAFAGGAFSFMTGAVLIGAYAAGLLFYFVFHSLIHPAKSAKYISINEMVVGLTSAIGPLAGGLIADHISHRATYIACILLTIAVLIVQIIVHKKHPFPVKDKNCSWAEYRTGKDA